MFFGSAVKNLFATHPDLALRIKRIEPNWKNSYPDTDKITEKATETSNLAGVAGFSSGQAVDPQPTSQPVSQPAVPAQTFLKTSTVPGKDELELARKLLEDMMLDIHDSCVQYGTEGDQVNYLKGSNIAGFVKVADAMLSYGHV